MKNRWIVLAALCGSLFLLSAESRAKHSPVPTHSTLPIYWLNLTRVADTQPNEYLWVVEDVKGGPGLAYNSLRSPSLLFWVTQLPKGTKIQYATPSYPTNREQLNSVPAFARYCRSRGVIFDDRFPILDVKFHKIVNKNFYN